MSHLVVIDVETTGLSPDEGDRIVEVAALRLDDAGRDRGSLATLINAGGGAVEATFVHGITAEHLVGAPRFEQVAAALGALADGAIFVGHYPWFDLRFLDAELRRMGLGMPACRVLDTRDLCRAAGQRGSLRLTDCCRFMGVTNELAHSALGDVRATAELLRRAAARGVDVGAHVKTWRARSSTAAWPPRPLADSAAPDGLSALRERRAG